MSDEPITTDPATPAAETPPAAESTTPAAEDQRVPYDRFKQVNDERAALAAKVEELSTWKKDQEQAQLTEIERAQ